MGSGAGFDPMQALMGAAGGGGAPPPDPAADPAAAAAPPEDALGGASVAPPSAGDASDTLKQIIDLFNIYMQEEQDPQDLATASKLQADTHKLLADQQKLVDTATGAGPGARMVRKATAAQGGGSGSGY
jgi:hypothetical protein